MSQSSSDAPGINGFFASRIPFQLPIGQFVHCNRFDGWTGSGRPKAADCTHVCGTYLDCDLGKGFETLEEIHTWLDSLPMRPTCRVQTGGGVHAWFLLEDEDGDGSLVESPELRDLPARFMAWAQTQVPRLDSVGDLARLLRMPGTTNTKRSPAELVEVVGEPGPSYVPSDFDWVPELPETTPTRAPVSPRAGREDEKASQGLSGDSVEPGAAQLALAVLTQSDPGLRALIEREPAATALYDDDDSRVDAAIGATVLSRLGSLPSAVEIASWAWRDSRRRHPDEHAGKQDDPGYVQRTTELLTRDAPVKAQNGSPVVSERGMEDHLAAASAIIGAQIVRIAHVIGVGSYVFEFESGTYLSVPHLSVEAQGRTIFQTAASQAGVVTTRFRAPKNGPDPWEVFAQHSMRAAVARDDGEASFPHEIVRQALRRLILGKLRILPDWRVFVAQTKAAPSVAHGYIHQSSKKRGPHLRFVLDDLIRSLSEGDSKLPLPELTQHLKTLGIRSVSASLAGSHTRTLWCAGDEFLEIAQEQLNESASIDRQLEELLGENSGGGEEPSGPEQNSDKSKNGPEDSASDDLGGGVDASF